MNDLVEFGQSAAVVLGDIRSSRLVADRAQAQVELLRLIASINTELGAALAIPFSVSAGDEVQAVLVGPEHVYDVIDRLDLGTAQFSLRFAVGWGPVSTAVARRSWEMDGECFYRARDALARGKEEARWVTIHGFGRDNDELLNAMFRLLQIVRDGWTQKQRTAVAIAKARATQKAAAKELGLDTSTLSKMLKAAHYREVTEIAVALGAFMHGLGPRREEQP